MKIQKINILLIIMCISTLFYNANAQQIETPEICMVSVDENNHNVVVWKKIENDDRIIGYMILRLSDDNSWYIFDEINDNETNIWIDTITNVNIRAHSYRILSYTDEQMSPMSSTHRTMHLTVNKGILQWNSYEGISYSTINIYRSDNYPTGAWQKIATIAGNIKTYTDTFSESDGVYYYVEIPFSESCAAGTSLNSIRSNIATDNGENSIVGYELSKVSVYPNPTKGELRVEIGDVARSLSGAEARYVSTTDIAIYDITGCIVFVASQFLSVGGAGVVINISHLQSGIYFLNLSCKELNQTIKIIKN
jgi:hypothetical protein